MGQDIIISKVKNKDNLSLPAFSISNKNGFVPQEEQFGKDNTYSKTDKSSNYIVSPKYFAYNPARINVGSIAYQNTKTPVLVSSLYEIFRSNNNIDDVFLQYWFKSEYFYKQIQRLQEGGVRQYFFIDKMKESRIYLTKVIEQNKIGALISKIDKLITLQQRKVKLLELLRKAIHNNIFPEYGKEIPVIRHKKFANKWNVVKFNTIYKKSTEKNDLTYGEDKIISVAKMYFKQEKNKSSQDYLKTYNVFRIGDIAFEGNRSEGFSHGRFVQNTIGNGIVSHVFDVFTPIKKDNLKYWKYAIHNEHVMKYVLVKSTTKATMMNNLSSKDFLKQSIAIPSSKEMNTIAKLLQDLDNQLNITNNKINYLQNMKQFLLQNMFI